MRRVSEMGYVLGDNVFYHGYFLYKVYDAERDEVQHEGADEPHENPVVANVEVADDDVIENDLVNEVYAEAASGNGGHRFCVLCEKRSAPIMLLE